MILRLEEVTKSFAGNTVVGPISLDFPSAATTVLLGAPGAGKSTLLRLLTGLERADQGQIFVDEIELNDSTLFSIRRRVALIVAGGALFPHMSAWENVTLQLRRARIRRGMIDHRLAELADLFRVYPEGFRRYPYQLNAWQKLRVAMIRALMPDPEILLFDDVLADFDRASRASAIRQLSEVLRRLNKAVVYVTHDLDEAACIADHAVFLHQGRLNQRGHLMDLIQNPINGYVKDFVEGMRPWTN
jgi:ABC-type proline/glycine betaine transport system ATPase subunit